MYRNYSYRVCYVMSANSVPPRLVYVLDQYGQHLLPVSDTTRVTEGTRSVNVTGSGDKRQITGVPVATMANEFVGLQAIWQGKTTRCEPKGVQQHPQLHHDHSESHWSTLPNMKRLVERIILPDMRAKVATMGLNPIQVAQQKSILLLDVWKVHLLKEFKDFLASNNIIPVYLDPGMTSKEQGSRLPSSFFLL